MNVPPQVLLDALNENKNSIYVMVFVLGNEVRRIRVEYPEAIDWVFSIARDHNGVVPYLINDKHEVYLGSVTAY